jgi:hypothetical protein
MKTLIAAGLAASALAAGTAASAYPIVYHHPYLHRVVMRGPIVYRGGIAIAPVYPRPVVYGGGFYRPFYRTAYYAPGYRGVIYRAPYHAYGWGHGPVVHHIAWRGSYVGEHRPA